MFFQRSSNVQQSVRVPESPTADTASMTTENNESVITNISQENYLTIINFDEMILFYDRCNKISLRIIRMLLLTTGASVVVICFPGLCAVASLCTGFSILDQKINLAVVKGGFIGAGLSGLFFTGLWLIDKKTTKFSLSEGVQKFIDKSTTLTILVGYILFTFVASPIEYGAILSMDSMQNRKKHDFAPFFAANLLGGFLLSVSCIFISKISKVMERISNEEQLNSLAIPQL